ncbi:MAG: hypothetical protein JOZ37_03175, partial [Actinobacteria bacterium]|nr:hypothetical protein [Actinomycetota bacterium]
MTESRRDLALLDTLAAALAPAPVEPSASELFSLRMAVASHHALVDGAPARRAAATRVPFWRRPWALASLATGMALAGTGAAMATGAAPVPDPVRAVAHAIGLPVDSPQVVQVQRATQTLQHDLSKPSTAPSPQTARDAQRLQQKLSDLSPSERERVGAAPARTLDRWRGPGPSSGPGSPSSSTPTGQAPSRPTGERTSGNPDERRGPSGGGSGPSTDPRQPSSGPSPQPSSTPTTSPTSSGPGQYPSPSGDRR